MKRLIKKLAALGMALTMFVGLFEFNQAAVSAAQEDPFDTSAHTVTGSGNYGGASWTTYDNGLLWVEDDKSGETSYSGNKFTLDTLYDDSRIPLDELDVKYIYYNITAPKICGTRYWYTNDSYYHYNNVIEWRLGDTFIDTSSNITDISLMFSGCANMVKCNADKLDTSNVTSFRKMFEDCRSLETIDVSNYDTSKAKDMSRMFDDCQSVKALDVTGFNTSNVTDMSTMFYGCESIKELDVTNFDTSNVITFEYMFGHCDALTSIDITGFDTSKVKSMSYMFAYCESLTSIDISNFNTSNVTDFSFMFADCKKLKEIDVSKLDTSKAEDIGGMFDDCYSFESVDISGMNISNIDSFRYMFRGCRNLKYIDLSSMDFSNIESIDRMVAGCDNLHMIKLPKNLKVADEEFDSTVWYKIKADKTVDRSQKLEVIPTTGAESVTVIREHNHTYGKVSDGVGTCSHCGLNVVLGDSDENGVIDVSDAVRMMKYLAGDTSLVCNYGAFNVNGDDIINASDAVRLKKYLAGMDVEFGVAD